jgi:hypothetical protein
MLKPDTLRWRLWDRLVTRLAAIGPRPGIGEAWCMYCLRNNGRTLVVGADTIWDHARAHETPAGPGED